MSHRKSIAIVVALIAALLMVGVVSAAGITINRNPFPPQGVLNNGTGVENYSWSVTHATQPDYIIEYIANPSGVPAQCRFHDETVNSPISTAPTWCSDLGAAYFYEDLGAIDMTSEIDHLGQTWTIPNGSPAGRYTINVIYYADTDTFENSAATTFYVANGLGNINLFKFEDINGNGIQDAGESPLANWTLKFTSPYQQTTFPPDPDAGGVTSIAGTVEFADIPTGVYTFTETIPSAWSKVTPTTTYTLTLSAGNSITATFGNIQKSSMGCTLLESIMTGTQVVPNSTLITYTLSYTKTGADEAVTPVASLYFTPTGFLTYVSDTSGATLSGLGTLASPYKWTFGPNLGMGAQAGSFDVVARFTAIPSGIGSITANGTMSSKYLLSAATNKCAVIQSFTPTTVELSSLQAQSTTSPVVPMALIGVSAVALSGVMFFFRRRKAA